MFGKAEQVWRLALPNSLSIKYMDSYYDHIDVIGIISWNGGIQQLPDIVTEQYAIVWL